jgi:MIP family channel proteins
MNDMRISSIGRRCLAEFLGTFTLVVLGPGAIMVAERTHAFGHTGVSIAFGLAVALVIAAVGHISGAHINPAVTIGLWSVRRFRGSDVTAYVVAQCAGAVLASGLSGWVLGPVASYGVTVPSLTLGRAFVVELGYSALLGFVIVALSSDDRAPGPLAALLIGATVFAGALVTGPLTGGSFNPARSFGPAVMSGRWNAHWLYWAAPIVGMLASMRLYDFLRPASSLDAAPAQESPSRDTASYLQPVESREWISQ